MYIEHFGLTELPFQLTPNTSYYFQTAAHNEAMDVLHVALDQGEGFIKVTGEVGMGKTLLCRMLLDELDGSDTYWALYLPNPMLTPEQLYQAIASELEIEVSGYDTLDLIHQQLIAHAQQGRHVVVLLDEAQCLNEGSFEALRLLGNLESETQKLVQIVLFGQPELNKRLESYQLRQIQQRICFSYHLNVWDLAETRAYIAYRLQTAGCKKPYLFTRTALFLLWQASGGIPRLISILAHKSLMLAYGKSQKRVNYAHVCGAICDTPSVKHYFTPAWYWVTGALIGVNGVILGVKWLL